MAVNDTWVRIRNAVAITGSPQDVSLVSIPLNDTIERIHGACRVIMSLPAHTAFSVVESQHIVVGLYTTLTVGGTILNPSTQSSDFAPPLQRWLWWEQFIPVSMAAPDQGYPDTRQKWIYAPAQNPIDIRAQVKATTAITLHLGFFSSAIPAAVKDLDLWAWWSILRTGLLSSG